MKLKNVILTGIIMLGTLGIMQSVSNAASPREMGILSVREGGYGYQVNVKNVWKIVEYKNNAYTFDNAFYCLKGGTGFGSSTYIENRSYNINYNMKDLSNMTTTIKSVLPTDEEETYHFDEEEYKYTNYNAVLWLLDNIYLPKATNAVILRDGLLSAVFPSAAKEEILLTDDDIEVVQQCALWYFTNSDTAYHYETLPAIQLTTQEGGLGPFDTTLDDLDDTWSRQDQAEALYEYLITMAKIKASSYGEEDNRSLVEIPAKFKQTESSATIQEGKCIIGPFYIEENQNPVEYTIEGILKDQSENIINYTLLDENRLNVAEGTTLKDLANRNFYISITDNTSITKVKFEIAIKYNDTDVTFWTIGASELVEQPIVEVAKVEKTFEDEVEVEIDRKVFDLALRKFITGVNTTKITNRVPEVKTDTILTKLTATYEHTKVPVSVTTGDIVTYTIRVYNEGELDGYAQKITDYIPEGLGFIIGYDLNSENNWLIDSNQDVNTIKLTTIQNATNNLALSDFVGVQDLNQVEVLVGDATVSTNILKYNNLDATHENLLKAFEENKALDYRDVQIACIVLADNVKETNLKNIAEITACVDTQGTVIQDRDSVPSNVNISTYPSNTNVEDDDDFESLILKEFDLALRKFITAVGDTEITDRVPMVRINETTGAITYEHTKEVVKVKNHDLVTYTIRVYNEGAIDGYASVVLDTLPDGLKFVEGNSINQKYGWVADGKTIKTTYLAKNSERDNLLKAYDNTSGKTPDYKDLQIVCEVDLEDDSNTILINTAEIGDDTNSSGGEITDRDSTPANNDSKEDDIDIEKVRIVNFDLSLEKFITKVQDTEITDRVPEVTLNQNGVLEYKHIKTPVEVKNNDIVEYTIRVYNEGNLSGYVQELKDDVPAGLIFLPDNQTNIEYGWKLQEDGTIRTTYLAKETNNSNEIKALDKSTMTTPDYKDVKVAFKVDETAIPSDRIIINTAEISKDYNEYNVKDNDSTPDNNNLLEDDIDKEYLKVKYFDLSLIKYVTQVIIEEDGTVTTRDTGHTGEENPEPVVKVDINRKKIKTTVVDFVYNIKITNEGEIAGYATEIRDDIPEGLEFIAENNPDWSIDENGKIVTRQLENTLLNPGENATVQIKLRWINSENNFGEKINVAEINEDFNESNSKDIDSTPGNNIEGEDDIDDAPVVLSIKTGSAPTYFSLIGGTLVILAAGIVLIKRYII